MPADRHVYVADDVSLAAAKAVCAEHDVSADRCAWLRPGTAVIVNVAALEALLGFPLRPGEDTDAG